MNTREEYIKSLEEKTGLSLKEIQKMNPFELRNYFHKKTSFDKLNPLKIKDARKIVGVYEQQKPPYNNRYYWNGVIPRKVIDAQLTIQGI